VQGILLCQPGPPAEESSVKIWDISDFPWIFETINCLTLQISGGTIWA